MARALVWFRRDLRLADNPALTAALAAGYAPIPVYIHAPEEDAEWAPGAASCAWLQRSLHSLSDALQARGSRLLIARGHSLEVLQRLLTETGAEAVFWNRLYEPALIARDAQIKSALKASGVRVESFNAALLVEPWTIQTGTGSPYRVFTPFWNNARQQLDGLRTLPTPQRLPAHDFTGIALAALALQPPAHEPRWDAGFWQHWQPGEAGASEMLDAFIEGAAHGYQQQRDLPDRIGTSRLSAHLHFGEISPRQIIQRLQAEVWPEATAPDIRHFQSELGWREFSYHLLYHFAHTPTESLNPRFAHFPWAEPEPEKLAAWQRGHTGVPIVDAGMRELWQTGWMHNRVRMIVASFLCKHLRYHWLHGARWFWNTLLDADLANNTQGWQWTAGTGADAAPYFRIFNPVAQAQRFDPAGRYLRRWLPELARVPDAALAAPWQHQQLRQWAPNYPAQPIVDLREGREAALAAYAQSKSVQ